MNRFVPILYRLLVNFIAIGFAAMIFKHAYIDGAAGLVLATIILTFCNYFVRPVLTFLSLPFVVLTMGLFFFVVNGLVVLLVSWIVPSFHVDGLWTAIGMSIVISIINLIANMVFVDKISNYDSF